MWVRLPRLFLGFCLSPKTCDRLQSIQSYGLPALDLSPADVGETSTHFAGTRTFWYYSLLTHLEGLLIDPHLNFCR